MRDSSAALGGAPARRAWPTIPRWVMAVPAIAALAWAAVAGVGSLSSRTASAATTAPSDAGIESRIAQRAAVILDDDLRGGLAHWEGQGDWNRSWTFDRSGFVQPGALAVYRPSRTLTDYRFEFSGQVRRRALNWAVRVAGPGDYHAVKMVVGGGAQPEIVIERWAVKGGRSGAVSRRKLPGDHRQDSVYRITTAVLGPDFSVKVDGKIADYWTDEGSSRGGVALFSGKGEQSRVYGLEIRHQDDLIGRICALLAPHPAMVFEGKTN